MLGNLHGGLPLLTNMDKALVLRAHCASKAVVAPHLGILLLALPSPSIE